MVETDKKGRILIPREFRRKIKARRFKMTAVGDKIELEPIENSQDLRGKYRTSIKSDWEKLEEMGEDYVAQGRR